MSEQVLEHLHRHDIELAQLNSKIDSKLDKIDLSLCHLEAAVGECKEVLVSGEEPVTTRLAVLERQAQFHNKTIRGLVKLSQQVLVEDTKQRWRFMMLMYLSILSMLSMLFTYAIHIDFFEWVLKLFR